MRHFLSLLLLVLGSFTAKAQYEITSTPKWVKYINYDSTVNDELFNPNYNYLLIDRQENTIEHTSYYRFSIKINGTGGVQDMSNIQLSFDPSFETLHIHEIDIIRGDKKINKLNQNSIQVFNREKNLERNLYDGRLTASIDLKDVRTGDIIEYSYSTKGINPFYENNLIGGYYFQFGLPIQKLFTRILFKNKEMKWRYFNGAKKPTKIETDYSTSFEWTHKNIPALVYEGLTPSWYNPEPSVSFSTYQTWGNLARNIADKYLINSTEGKYLAKFVNENFNSENKSDNVIEIIRFVQDKVRYLGFENGLNGFKPHSPVKVLENRYGDCKDKSLLLVGLLRSIDIEAYPVLVHATNGKNLNDKLPSPKNFDHCIVKYSINGVIHFVDPTMQFQGGDISNSYVPDYHYGLVISSNTADLEEIKSNLINKVRVTETLRSNEINQDITFEVKTEYYGAAANSQRYYFANNNYSEIKKQYENYYSNLYPNLEIIDLQFQDSNRTLHNKFEVTESYIIKNPWLKSESNPDEIYLEIYPLGMETYLDVQKTANRTMPFFIGNSDYEHIINVYLPEEWNINVGSSEISNEYFKFKLDTDYYQPENLLSLSYDYKTKKEWGAAKDFKDFSEKHQAILNDLGFNLSYDALASNNDISYLAIFFFIVLLALFILLARWIYHNFNPSPESLSTEPKQIGGWLILPIIGFCLTPVYVVANVFGTSDYFSKSAWLSLISTQQFDLLGLIAFEIVFNISLIVFSILILVTILKKRSSAPKLVVAFYAINLIFTLIDAFIANQLQIPYASDGSTEIIRSVIAAIIWIPYFLKSDRVKETFVNTVRTI